MNWRFDWLDGGEAYLPDDIRSRWDDAFELYGNIWQCRQFCRSWDENMAVAQKQQAVLLIASDRAGHQVIYPLYVQRRKVWNMPFTIVEPMGGAISCDYQDPLSTGDPMREVDWQAFWTGLREALPRRFGRLSELRVYRLTDLCLAGGGGFQFSTVSPFIPLHGVTDLRSLLATRGRNLRERVGRLLRRLQDRGGYVLRRISSNSIHDAIGEFCQCYAEQWGGEGRNQSLPNPEARLYWLSLATSAEKLNKLHFTAFEVNGEPWHWHLGFEHRGVLLWYKMTYNVHFSQFSPGILHLALLVEEGIARGVRRLDLGYGAEDYKFKWTEHSRKLLGLRVGSLMPLTDAAKRTVRQGRALRRHLSNLWGHYGRASTEA